MAGCRHCAGGRGPSGNDGCGDRDGAQEDVEEVKAWILERRMRKAKTRMLRGAQFRLLSALDRFTAAHPRSSSAASSFDGTERVAVLGPGPSVVGLTRLCWCAGSAGGACSVEQLREASN
eukprot:326642-Rhodomonas_salina.1